MVEGMTSRERWLASLKMEPVDRFPFWPKLDAAYLPAQDEAFRHKTVEEMFEWIGADPQVGGGTCVKPVYKDCRVETVRENGTEHTTWHTPLGNLTRTQSFDPVSHSWHPRTFPVRTGEDIDRMIRFQEDLTYDLDPEALAASRERVGEVGDGGMPVDGIGYSPLMDWLQYIAGLEQGHFLLMDYPEKVELLLETQHRNLLRKTEILAAHSACQAVYSVENTSTTLISPAMFRKYCVPHLGDYGRILTDAGKMHMLHMCGLLKDLLPDIATLPAVAVEAFTSPPVGNTTLADGRSDCPETCLIGGTNASLWLRPAKEIIARIERDLNQLPHRRGLIPSSAGVMPPACHPKTIREVCQWLKTIPVG